MPIRVLQVIGKMDRGGAETMIMNLYRNINRQLVQFDFLVHSKEPGSFDNEIKQLGGRIFYIQQFKGYNLLPYYLECRRFFEEHTEISVVHGHIGSSAAIYLKAAKKNGCFTIAHSHNAVTKISNVHDLFYTIFSFPTRFVADQLFGCSTEAGRSRFGKRAICSSKYQNFSNGIDVDDFLFDISMRKKVRNEFGINDDDVVIGTVGRFAIQKNPMFLLSIFEKLVTNNSNVSCIWVGSGDLFETVKNSVIAKNLQDRIFLTGVRNDIPAILQALDCFVFPSLWEGLPVTIIEAQAAGVGIVLSDVISKEVAITDLITWKNLSESSEDWAKACLSVAISNKDGRNSPSELLKEKGYDVKETAKWLQAYYLDKSEDNG